MFFLEYLVFYFIRLNTGLKRPNIWPFSVEGFLDDNISDH